MTDESPKKKRPYDGPLSTPTRGPVTVSVFKRYAVYKSAMRHRMARQRATQELAHDPRVDFLIDQMSFRLSRLIESLLLRDESDIERYTNAMLDLPHDFVTFVAARDRTQGGESDMSHSVSYDRRG